MPPPTVPKSPVTVFANGPASPPPAMVMPSPLAQLEDDPPMIVGVAPGVPGTSRSARWLLTRNSSQAASVVPRKLSVPVPPLPARFQRGVIVSTSVHIQDEPVHFGI